MKTAICLSGLIRDFATVGHTYNQFIVAPLGCTVFIHTWDNITVSSTGARFGGSTSDKILDKEKFFQEIFPNQKVVLRAEEFPPSGVPLKPKTGAIMFYSIYQANKLKKQYEKDNNFLFDLVFRARMDHLFERKLLQNEIEVASNLDNKKLIYIGNNLLHKGLARMRNIWNYNGIYGVDDQFAFGSSEALDVFANTFKERENLNIAGGELVLAEQLVRNGIVPIRSWYRFKGLQHLYKNESSYWEDYDEFRSVTFNRVFVSDISNPSMARPRPCDTSESTGLNEDQRNHK